jgi:hypothetical protein
MVVNWFQTKGNEPAGGMNHSINLKSCSRCNFDRHIVMYIIGKGILSRLQPNRNSNDYFMFARNMN